MHCLFMEMPMPRRGVDAEGKRFPLGFRTTREIRERLEKAAAASGRSLAQEVELRLERSFHFDEMTTNLAEQVRQMIERTLVEAVGGPGNFSVVAQLGYLMRYEEQRAGAQWRENEAVRHRVEAQMLSVIPGLLRSPPRPWGEPMPPDSEAARLLALGSLYNEEEASSVKSSAALAESAGKARSKPG
jgi:hypothetical protein